MTILRSRFEVEGSMRFLSHLDILRIVGKTLRRAEIPVAFSQGFNPHPLIAFGPPRPVGMASRAEYFDVELKEHMNPLEFQERFQEQCPGGLLIRKTGEIPRGTGALNAVINCATYLLKVEYSPLLTKEELNNRVKDIFNKEEIIIFRHSPKGTKQYDIRPGVWQLSASPLENGAVVEMEIMTGSSGNVKPGEVADSLGIRDYKITEMVRTGLFTRLPEGERIVPL
ncbi:MAG: TIGR03936 family radical SAM-associated protein [Desulfitobacteriaceae bacterium]|nr:TIGR03936 family radical SAM-associated protein [Desulfitobacteriaceae bacterium]